MIVLIADDERLIRFTLKSMLTEILPDGDNILEAANGRDLVRLCREYEPDIVFADIKMPYMNGLEAIEECIKAASRAEFVVISGYSEFEYARTCIRLGINEYVLKPIEQEKVEEIIGKLQEKIRLRKRDSNSSFQMRVQNFFNYYALPGEENEDELRAEAGWKYWVFGLIGKAGEKEQISFAGFQKRMIGSMRETGDRIVEKKGGYSFVYSMEGIPYFIFYVDMEKESTLFTRVRRICALEMDKNTAACLACFQADSLRKIYEGCERIDEEAWLCMNARQGSLIMADDMVYTEEEKSFLTLLLRLSAAWDNTDEMAFREIRKELEGRKRQDRPGINYGNLAAYLRCITGETIEADSFEELMDGLKRIGDKLYRSSGEEDADIVARVKEYIARYYMNDISIGQLAEQYNLTPNYLSTLFHKKENCKFVDYLTDVRITNAKRLLLQNPTASVGDIALMVGYGSARYFSALFQKVTGLLPTAYRNVKSVEKRT